MLGLKETINPKHGATTIKKNGLIIGGYNPVTGKEYTEKQIAYFNRKQLVKNKEKQIDDDEE